MSFADSIREIEPAPERGIGQDKLEIIQQFVRCAEEAVKATAKDAAAKGKKSISGFLGFKSDYEYAVLEIDEKSLDKACVFRVDRFIQNRHTRENSVENISNGRSNLPYEHVARNGKYIEFSQGDLKDICSSVSEMIYNLGFQIYSVTTVERTFYRIDRVEGFFGNYKEKRHPVTTGRVLKIEISW